VPSCNWITFDAFRSLAEYKKLLSELEAGVAAGLVEQRTSRPGKGMGNSIQRTVVQVPRRSRNLATGRA